MTAPRGYVVRAEADGEIVAARRREAVGEAVAAWEDMTSKGCAPVRIYRVAEDGTETPLPTYEEALAQIAAIDAAFVEAGIEALDPKDTLLARVARLIADANEEGERTLAAEAEAERLRGEVEQLKRANAALRYDAERAPRFVPFAVGEIS
jgi:hypothetical protein